MNSTKLVDYFTSKQGKYLILPDENKVRLSNVDLMSYIMRLTFTYNTEVVAIDIDKLYSDSIEMHIPQGLYMTTVVKIPNTQSVSSVLHKVLEEWVRQVQNDGIFGFVWEEL
ncbi:hypothetical protein VL14_ORF157 [Staphylococcus phage vB_SauM_VL14]|nr:hypothetical protein VL14_ORF157 [Staphylococcus phage vB_SauM_VL14]